MNNQFSVVKGCSKYIVFSCGRVFNRKSKRFLPGMKLSGIYNNGYIVYALYSDDGTVRYISLRHLLAEAFLEGYVPGCEIHVIDKHNQSAQITLKFLKIFMEIQYEQDVESSAWNPAKYIIVYPNYQEHYAEILI